MIEYKGYTGLVEFDPELRIFAGYVVDLKDEIYFEGTSVKSLEESLRRAVDHYLSVCKQRGEDPEKPFSGKLNVRLGSDLHRAAAIAAASEGESLNNWLVRIVNDAAQDRLSKESVTEKRRDSVRKSSRPRRKQSN